MPSGFASNRRRHLNGRSTRVVDNVVNVATGPKKSRADQSEFY